MNLNLISLFHELNNPLFQQSCLATIHYWTFNSLRRHSISSIHGIPVNNNRTIELAKSVPNIWCINSTAAATLLGHWPWPTGPRCHSLAGVLRTIIPRPIAGLITELVHVYKPPSLDLCRLFRAFSLDGKYWIWLVCLDIWMDFMSVCFYIGLVFWLVCSYVDTYTVVSLITR